MLGCGDDWRGRLVVSVASDQEGVVGPRDGHARTSGGAPGPAAHVVMLEDETVWRRPPETGQGGCGLRGAGDGDLPMALRADCGSA